MTDCTLVLTTQCNLACRYCTIRNENGAAAQRERVLEECRRAVSQGARRFQLAGGEPLLLEDLPGLIREMKAIPGVDWVCLTTNGALLYPALPALQQAGLDAVNLHLDACDAFTFTSITGKSQLLNEILQAIWNTVARGIPLTVSAVLLEDNASHLAVLAGLARQYDLCVRFVAAPAESGESGPDQTAALEILGRSIKGLTFDGTAYRAPGWKGCIAFGASLWGAFQMEEGCVVRCDGSGESTGG